MHGLITIYGVDIEVPGYGDFLQLIRRLSDMTDQNGNRVYGHYMREAYTDNEIQALGAYIQPLRDELFTYVGLQHLTDRYLIKGFDGGVLDLRSVT